MKNKSIEFVKQRIQSGNTGLELNVLDDCYEMSFIDAAQQCLTEEVYNAVKQNNCLKLVLSINDNKADFSVKYDPDAEFEYFTMISCVCDGTLIFLLENIAEIINKVLYMKTYNTTTLPFDYVEHCDKYKTTYTVGNLVICSEFGEYGVDDWVPEDKKWMRTRWTVMLPIKTEYELKEKTNEN